MCMTPKMPSAPVNKPSYAPNEAHKHFNFTMQDEDGKEKRFGPKPPSQDKKQGLTALMADRNRPNTTM